MALSRVWQLGTRQPFRAASFHSKSPVFRPPKIQVVAPVRPLFYRAPYATTLDALRVWKLMECMGVSHCTIVKFRRRMKRFTYPWIAYSIPAAVILGMGDMIAQYHLKEHPPDRTIGSFFREGWAKGETLFFMLTGFLLVGPLLSKWNLYLYRKMRCQQSLNFLIKKLLLDLLIFSPILLSLVALLYGLNYDPRLYQENDQKTKDKIRDSYWTAIKDSCIFNLLTRPLAAFSIFYLAPIHLRRLFKTVYETVFSAYVSDTLRKNLGLDKGTKGQSPPKRGWEQIKRDPFAEKKAAEQNSRWARYKKWACKNKGAD